MLKNTYEAKGMNVLTSAFIEHVLREGNQSKYSIKIDASPYSSDSLRVTIEGNDSARMNSFVTWLKSASKGVSKITGVRKL